MPDLSLLQLLAISGSIIAAMVVVLAGWADQDRMRQ